MADGPEIAAVGALWDKDTIHVNGRPFRDD